jgi:hypothetical protein
MAVKLGPRRIQTLVKMKLLIIVEGYNKLDIIKTEDI